MVAQGALEVVFTNTLPQIDIKPRSLKGLRSAALVFGVYEEEGKPEFLKLLDEKSRSLVINAIKTKVFSGKKDQADVIFVGNKNFDRIVLYGLGKKEELNLQKIREFGGNISKRLRDSNLLEFSLYLPIHTKFSERDIAVSFCEGANLGLYDFSHLKTKDKKEKKRIERIYLLCNTTKAVLEGINVARVISEGVYIARDLINYPANFITPVKFCEIAQGLCRKYGVGCEILDREKLEELGFGALIGVARGSVEEPRFLLLKYNDWEIYPTVGVVGKGITFDTGGISIKPAQLMHEMKGDMAGAAAALCAIITCARLKIPINIIAGIPLAENTPSGSSIKPGDILHAYNGKTIEVINTDAEGRLILADGLSFLSKNFKLDYLVDLATLTGGCIVALGKEASGVMGTSQSLISKILFAGEKTFERCWQLPLWEEYKKLNESALADVANLGSKEREASAIVGGAFLSEFVEKKVSWAHIDIAGPSFDNSETAYLSKGGRGVGVRLLVQLFLDISREKE